MIYCYKIPTCNYLQYFFPLQPESDEEFLVPGFDFGKFTKNWEKNMLDASCRVANRGSHAHR